jgi:N-acetyltransferase
MNWLDPVVLLGARIRLEPLDPDAHTAPMFQFFEPRVTEFLSRGGTEVVTERDLREHLEMINALPNRRNWAVRVLVGDHIAGRISFSEINPSDEWLEIGTMLMPPFWGGAANAEGKLLLMTRAFETLGVNRVQFKVDARNERSQGSMEKLGAVREGVLRQYQKRTDGFIRDSVMYSVLKSEWPGVKARLQARLVRL